MLRRFPSSDSTAAKEEDIAALSGKPVTAYLLGHDVGAGSGAREQAVMVGAVARSSSGSVSWVADLPQGCTGAPVFTSARFSGDTFKLVCIGVVLPGDGHHPIEPSTASAPPCAPLPRTSHQPLGRQDRLRRRWNPSGTGGSGAADATRARAAVRLIEPRFPRPTQTSRR